jgi:hypothetical protein
MHTVLCHYAIFEHSERYLQRKFMQSQALNINLGQDVIAGGVIGAIIHEKNQSENLVKPSSKIKPRTSIILHSVQMNRLCIQD